MLLPKTAKADVEPIRQRTQFSCMSASLSMCLQAHGTQDCDEDTVNRVMGAKPMQGATWEQALACSQHYGMRATLMSPCTVKQLKAWTDAGTPVMIAWNPEGREWSHASVVFDVDDDLNVSVADPNIPDPDETVRVVSKDDFYKKWYEKWPDYLVRRPAMAIEREITKDGRQVKASLFIPMVVHETARRKLQKKPPASTWKPEHHPRPEGQLVVRHREEKPKSWWERVKDKFHGSDRTSEEDILEAGKKERRSIKDRGMARKIKYGPETHEEKSEGSASMERAMWEIRKQEGRAGLPGAGMGAGPHKDKSMYERKREKQVEHEASSLTQPLMTRRDYGAETMDIRDYETALKTSKFEKGLEMTLDEVARVVGPEFKEMNEDPPDSVVKVRKEMVGKTAAPDLMAMEAYADMLKDSKFEKDKPADPTVNMSPEDAAEWERQNEEHKDEFKAATSEEDVPFDLFFNGRQAAEKASGKWGFTKAVEGACMAGVNKLQKTASRIASNLYAKDDKSPAFLQKHAIRGMSKSAAMLLKAMEGLGPMAKLTKTAGRTGMGLYGFPSKTAKLGIEACGALHHEAGEIACDMFARKGADPIKIAGFLKKNATKGKCAYSDMLGDCAPELEAEITAKVVQAEDVPKAAPKAGKKASDFMASDDSEVAAIMADIMADESTSPKFLDEGDISSPKC